MKAVVEQSAGINLTSMAKTDPVEGRRQTTTSSLSSRRRSWNLLLLLLVLSVGIYVFLYYRASQTTSHLPLTDPKSSNNFSRRSSPAGVAVRLPSSVFNTSAFNTSQEFYITAHPKSPLPLPDPKSSNNFSRRSSPAVPPLPSSVFNTSAFNTSQELRAAILNGSQVPLLTLFSSWVDRDDLVLVRNLTLRNWAMLKPWVQPVLFTNHSRLGAEAQAAGWSVLPVSKTAIGVPVLKNMYLDAMARYEILQCGDSERLIRKRETPNDPLLYFVTTEETYDIIKRAHVLTGHGGRDRIEKELWKKYANIPRQAIELFKSMCNECQKKKKRPRVRGVVVKPIVSSNYLSRAQIDLIDMQSLPDGNFKWICVYQDHFTKFCLIRPLTSKQAAEVAYHLLDIFFTVGAPAILQSDNGAEFTASVIKEVTKLWPELRLVHGKPRMPQSQGSVERANGDIKDSLVAWMNDNETCQWTNGVKFVQFYKNSSYHAGIRMTPFKATFGDEAKIGLRSSRLPNDIIDLINTEEDLQRMLQSSGQDDNPSDPVLPISGNQEGGTGEQLTAASLGSETDTAGTSELTGQQSVAVDLTDFIDEATTSAPHFIDEATTSTPHFTDAVTAGVFPVGVSQTPEIAQADDEQHNDVQVFNVVVGEDGILDLEQHVQQIKDTRKRTKRGQLLQAERMLKRSRKELTPAARLDTVMVPIPLVDKGRGDPRNIMGLILDCDGNEMYSIGVKAGVLRGRYSRNQFIVCEEKLLTEENISQERVVSLREAVACESLGGGQGFVKCNCNLNSREKSCQTNRCKCYKAKVKCNSGVTAV